MNALSKLFPFILWLPRVNGSTLLSDLMAGLTGAIVVLPQGIAYALIAGLPAQYGLYTAIVVPVLASFFGSSKHMITGPAAAISIVVMGVVSNVVSPGTPEFISSVFTLTLMVGLIQLALGMARMGGLVNFISHTVVIGFTSGAALLIATSQLPHVIGVHSGRNQGFVDSWAALLDKLPETNYWSLLIALTAITASLISKRISSKLPAMFIGMLAAMLVAWLVDAGDKGVSFVGAVPAGLPELTVPNLSFGLISDLFPGAFALAILGLVEAVSIARAISLKSGQRIVGNQEFIGQGLANTVGSFCASFASSGSFTRSGVNFDAGAKTPVAALFASVFVLLILLFLPEMTAYLPLPAMGGAVLLIAWNLIDYHHIKTILRFNRSETIVLLTTFIATLFVQLEFAIYLGVILSIIGYLKRTSKPRVIAVAPRSLEASTDLRNVERFHLTQCPAIRFLRIDGSLFFGAVDNILDEIEKFRTSAPECTHLALCCSGVNFIDLSGAQMLLDLKRRLQEQGGRLSLVQLKNTAFDELVSSGVAGMLETDSFYQTPDDLLAALIDSEFKSMQCTGCAIRIFKQCPKDRG
uniref:SulP family inorganic anion transporter n=1 Tax=Marinobacterium zhoushanense TaxID=1679163 RepID=UPI001E2C3B4D|nr:SulP family inorganic anion transporter [Marinobacterium zhoushanense]